MTLPTPLVHEDVDLRPIDFMPLYGHRLFGSGFDIEASDMEFRAGIRLWWAAFQSKPAGSLPNNAAALCQAAGFGRDLRGWARIQDRAMHGFILCADDRFYHPLLAEAVMVAWRKRKAARDRKRRQREEQDHLEQMERDARRDGSDPSRACPAGQDAPVPPPREGKVSKGREIPSESLIPPSPPSGARSPRGTRLPDDWIPSSEDVRFAEDLGLVSQAVADRFRDYWRAKPGKDGVKRDWSAVWRNWCRQDAERQQQRGRSDPPEPNWRNGFAAVAYQDWEATAHAAPDDRRSTQPHMIDGASDVAE